MGKNLNDKGITLIEIIVCFALVSVIVISMFKVINNYKIKQEIESDRSEIIKYKNTVTKKIMDFYINNENVSSPVNEYDIKDENNNTYHVFEIKYYGNDYNLLYSISVKKLIDKKTSTATEEINISDKDNKDKYVLPNISGLKFNDVYVKQDDDFLYIRVGLSHPDLGNIYDALNLIIPVNEFKL